MSSSSKESKAADNSESTSISSSVSVRAGAYSDEDDKSNNFDYSSDDDKQVSDCLGGRARGRIELFMPRCDDEVSEPQEERIPFTNNGDDEEEEVASVVDDDNDDDDRVIRGVIKQHEEMAKEHIVNMNGDSAVEEYVRCLTLKIGRWSGEKADVWSGRWMDGMEAAVFHCRLADVYMQLKGYPLQALEHCQNSRSIIDSIEKDFANYSLLHSFSTDHGSRQDAEDGMISTNNSSQSIKNHRNIRDTQAQKYEAFKNSPGHYHLLLDLLFTRTSCFLSLDKPKKAERLLLKCQRMLTLLEKGRRKDGKKGGRRREVLIIENRMQEMFVRIYEEMNKPDLALDHLERILNTACYDNDPEKMVAAYHTMGRLQQKREGGEVGTERALESYMKANDLLTQLHGEGSLEVADSSFQVALRLLSSGYADDVAESYLQDSLQTYKRILSMSDGRTLECIDELAKLRMRRGEIEQALELLMEALVHKKVSYPHYCSQVSTHLKTIATCHLALNRPQEALKFFKKCSKIEKVVYPAKHKELLSTQKSIQMLLNSAFKKK